MAKPFKPGGKKGKLHRELHVPVGEKIPTKKLEAAMHSGNPEIKRDAIRAKTMEGWRHTGPKVRAHKASGPKVHMVRRSGVR